MTGHVSVWEFLRRGTKKTDKHVPEYVYAPSREEAQRLLDESYLRKYVAVPLGSTVASPEQIRRWRQEATTWTGDDYLWVNRFLEATTEKL